MGRDERNNNNDHKIHLTGLPGGPQTPRLRDAVGRVLEPGDEVLVVTPTQHFRVASVSPVLHPGAPPNTVLLTLVTRLAMGAPRDAAVEGVYFLRHASEIGDGMQFSEHQDRVEEPPA